MFRVNGKMGDSLNTLLLLSMAAGGFAFICGGIFMLRDSFLIQSRRGLASGRVEETRFVRNRSSDSDREAFVIVAFKTHENTEFRFEQAAPSGLFTSHTAASVQSLEGREVKVHYDRKKPERATITPIRDSYSSIAFLLIGLFIFTAVMLG